jgi:hypothetical protein
LRNARHDDQSIHIIPFHPSDAFKNQLSRTKMGRGAVENRNRLAALQELPDLAG